MASREVVPQVKGNFLTEQKGEDRRNFSKDHYQLQRANHDGFRN